MSAEAEPGMGIGAGYHGPEAEAMGLPLPPVAERFGRLEETLQIAARMWAGDDTAFAGSTTGCSARWAVRHPSSAPTRPC